MVKPCTKNEGCDMPFLHTGACFDKNGRALPPYEPIKVKYAVDHGKK